MAKDDASAQPTPPPGEDPKVPPEGSVAPEQPGAPATPPPEGMGEPSGTESGKGDLDPTILKRERDEARREAATERKRRAALEGKAEDERKAKLTDVEKEREERETFATEKEAFEQERTRVRLESAMLRVGSDLQLNDPLDALWLLNWDDIEVDEKSGNPTNLKDLVQGLIEQKPYLVRGAVVPRAPNISSGAGSAPAAPPRLTADELAAANEAGLAPEAYATLKTKAAEGRGVSLADWQATRAGQAAPETPKNVTGTRAS